MVHLKSCKGRSSFNSGFMEIFHVHKNPPEASGGRSKTWKEEGGKEEEEGKGGKGRKGCRWSGKVSW